MIRSAACRLSLLITDGTTPALTKFIEEAGKECDGLTVKLAKIR